MQNNQTPIDVRIEASWKEALSSEFAKPYFASLVQFVRTEYASSICYPPASLIFNAFNTTPLHCVRVVILGQDPYHGPGQAHGLCFSVNDGVPFPPSLKNIFQEIKDETGAEIPLSGNLTRWAQQGVFLLNTCLSVRQHQAFSHSGRGWEEFTDAVIRTISERCNNVVFLLWGSPAGKKASLIDASRHLILRSAHPSPLSSYRGFFGNGHFRLTNEYLQQHSLTPIKW